MKTVYSKQHKQEILKRLLDLAEDPNVRLGALRDLSREVGIPLNTIYSWNSDLKGKTEKLSQSQASSSGSQSLSSARKFQLVLATAQMTEQELGSYLRREGITKEDLSSWRTICEGAIDARFKTDSQYRAELLKERSRTRKLEAELRRKEKALAEAAALLVLRGKADAIWGASEED